MAAVDTDRAEWLAWRNLGIGASDIASIARIPGAFSTPYAVWAERAGLIQPKPDDQVDDLLRWGKAIEPVVAELFHERTGLHVVGEQTWCVHPEHAWMRATPDGGVAESPATAMADALGTLEIKFDKSWSPWEEIPLHYQAQGQWQMAVTGMPRTWFAVIHGWRPMIYELERSQVDIDWLMEVGSGFWHNHVLTGVSPDVDGFQATTDALAQAWQGVPDLSGNIDHLAHIVAEWDAAKARLTMAEWDLAKAANRIKAFMGPATEATVTDAEGGQRPVFTWRTQNRSNVDLDGLRQRYPRAIARFTHPNPVRSFVRSAPRKTKKKEAFRGR